MSTYKLDRVLYSPKKEKLRIQNGRSDILLELNSGFTNFRQLLSLVSDQNTAQTASKITIRVEYINHSLSYFMTANISEKTEISYPGSTWRKVEGGDHSWKINEILHGSYHINVADGAINNPIDDIVLSNKNKEFAIEIELVKNLDIVSTTILSKLSDVILKLSKEKQQTQNKLIFPASIVMGSNITKVFIDKEWLHNYLYDFYYYMNQSSNFFLFPIIRVYSNNEETLSCVKNSLISGSKKKNVNTNINYLFEDQHWDFPKNVDLAELGNPATQENLSRWINEQPDLFFYRNDLFGMITNVNFVSALFAFSETKIPGIAYTEDIHYGTVGESLGQANEYCLGLLHKNYQTQIPINMKFDDLIMHTLVTGVTGSGKTTTIKSLLYSLYESKIPFLILEPAKTEYKTLMTDGLRRYILGIDTRDCFKLNPFEFPYATGNNQGIHLQTHLDLLKSIFIAAFPMYGPMPYILETAFYHIYKWYGWDFKSGLNVYWDRTEPKSELFPTLEDLYSAIDHIVNLQGYSQDLQNDLTAALKVRIGSLKSGAKGTILNTKHGTSIEELLLWPTVIELELIGDAQEKVFIMGLLLVSIYEYYIANGIEADGKLKHLMVIEEAHRLLENSQQSNNNEIADMKGKAIETFNNILSEIRAYGQGIVVADQIPTKISPDVIKNTNLKIVHRLFSLDDRNAVGDSIGLDHKQKKGLIHLKTGEAILFHSGLQEAVKIMANSRGLNKGDTFRGSEQVEMDTLDVIVHTTAIYSKLKKFFQSALIFNWDYHKLQTEIICVLGRFALEVDEELVDALISSLVVWFAVKLRNNTSIPYAFPKEMELKQLGKEPKKTIDGIRKFISRNGNTIQFPASLDKTYIDALDYFIYVFTEDRKALSVKIMNIRNALQGKFKYYDLEAQSLLLAETDMDKYICTENLTNDEIVNVCQCLVYFCSYPHTSFESYFNVPNSAISDEKYKKFIEASEEQKQVNTPEVTTPIGSDIKLVLNSIADSLRDITKKTIIDKHIIKQFMRLPHVLLMINSLLILLITLFLILR